MQNEDEALDHVASFHGLEAPEDTGCGERLVVGARNVTSFPSKDALDTWAKTFFR